eukprot:5152033-Prymnesium_polylepis.2
MAESMSPSSPTLKFPEDVRIVALSLKGSARVSSLRLELAKHGLFDHTEIIENERDELDGLRGCFTSHQKACAAFLSEPSLKVLIVFEDDVVFKARGSLNLVQSINMVADAIRTSVAEQIAIGGVPMTHAYGIGRAGARKVMDLTFCRHFRLLRIGDHIDHCMSSSLDQAILYPTVAFQRAANDVTSAHSLSRIYFFLTHLRDLVGQKNVQICLEYLFRFMGMFCICYQPSGRGLNSHHSGKT